MKDILSPEQRTALDTLSELVDPAAYLAGGVAVALRLGHRRSRDLDVFTPDDPLIADAAVLEPRPSVRVLSRATGTLQIEVHGVPASVLQYRYPLLAPVERLPGVPMPLASLDDLECMKLSAIAGRGAARDFWDLHILLTSRKRRLEESLEAYRRKYSTEDIGHVVRSLVYFAEAEADPMPEGLSPGEWQTIRGGFETWVKQLA